MKKRAFTLLTLLVTALALTAVGEEKPLSLEGTKWKLVGFVDAKTDEIRKVDDSTNFLCYNCPKPAGPEAEKWYTLEFNIEFDTTRGRNYSGYFSSEFFRESCCFNIDYTNSTITFGKIGSLDAPLGSIPDEEKYFGALTNAQTFELTDTSLKIYYNEKSEYLLFKLWEPAPSKVLDADRIVRQSTLEKEVQTVAVAPEIMLSPNVVAAGPNPVAKSAGIVNFYRTGKQVKSAALKIYDASGKAVGKISISDKSAAQGQSKRQAGSWNLKDAKGSPIADGTYLVKGTIKTVDGKSENIALLIGVR
jgi:hypothetical protein